MDYFYICEVEISYIDVYDEIHRSVKRWTDKERLFDLARNYTMDDNSNGKRKLVKVIKNTVLNNFEPYNDLKDMVQLLDVEYEYAFEHQHKRKFTVMVNVGNKDDVRKFKLKYPKWHEYLSNV